MTTTTSNLDGSPTLDPEGAALGALAQGGSDAQRTGPRSRPRLHRLGVTLQGPRWTVLRTAFDCAVLTVAALAALGSTDGGSTGMVIAFPLVVLAMTVARPGPDHRAYGSILDTIFHILGTTSLAAVLDLASAAAIGISRPVDMSIRLWLMSFALLTAERVSLVLVRRRAMATEDLAVPTLILGAGVVGERLAQRLAEDHRYGLKPIGFLDAFPRLGTDPEQPSPLPVLGSADELTDALRATGAGHVILAFTHEPDHELLRHVHACERLGVGVSLVPRLYESITVRSTLDHVGGLPLVGLRDVDPLGWQFTVKHWLGRMLAASALVMLAPVLAALALAARLTSRGPVFARSARVGRDGKEFQLANFSSPRLQASGLGQLPQLLNVLRGEMAIVGPHPERPEIAARLREEVPGYAERMKVMPGITGWAQVNGLHGPTSLADRTEWDNFYVQNWTLRLDLRIIVLTVIEVFRPRNT